MSTGHKKQSTNERKIQINEAKRSKNQKDTMQIHKETLEQNAGWQHGGRQTWTMREEDRTNSQGLEEEQRL